MSQALAASDIVTPFPIQSVVVPAALAGGDVLAKSPTGSGKTLAFGVPIVDRISPESGAPAALDSRPDARARRAGHHRPDADRRGQGIAGGGRLRGTPVHKGAK